QQLLVIADDQRAEPLMPEEIERCEVHGPPVSLPEAVGAIPPETLARHAQLLAAALQAPAPHAEKRSKPAFDPGKTRFTSSCAPDGRRIVHAALETRAGKSIFDTAGTQWSVHGVEQFENGTSLYLHHRDHPAQEQRVIIWPPDRG